MKLKTAGILNLSQTAGFVTIEDKGNAQQATFNIEPLKELSNILRTLERLGFNKITLTLEDDNPLIIGTKTIGIALAGIVEQDDT